MLRDSNLMISKEFQYELTIKEKEKQNKKKDDELKKIQEELNKQLNSFKKEKEDINIKISKLEEKYENEMKIYRDQNKSLNLKNMELLKRNTELQQKNKYIENKFKLLQIKKDPPESVSLALIGLNKVGGIPYMNSILQCLSNTIELTKYFLKESDKMKSYDEDENEYELSKSYLMIIEKLWNVNKNLI